MTKNKLPILAIEIDGVIRDFLSKFDEIYRKTFIYNTALVDTDETGLIAREPTEEEIEARQQMVQTKERELITLPLTSMDLLNHYKFAENKIEMFKGEDISLMTEGDHEPIVFSPKQNLESFLYESYPFQIFAKASEYAGAMDAVNKIQAIGLKNNLFETILVSNLKKHAISATFYFLGSCHCRIKNIQFIENDEDKWDLCDALIDVSPRVLEDKPKGKTSIKIEQTYNSYTNCDYSFDTIKKVVNENFLKSIFENKK